MRNFRFHARSGPELKPAKLLSLVLALSLAFFVVESAIHSVHHLNDGDEENSCSVLATSQHLHGAVSDVDVAFAAPTVIHGDAVAAAAPGFSSRSFRPDEGRAPPLAPSV